MVRQNKTTRSIRVLAAIAMVSTAVVTGAVGPASAAPPSNDDFANAQFTLVSDAAVIGTTVDATTEVGEPAQSCSFQGDALQRSIWWKVDPGEGAHLFTTTGSSIDTQMSVYTGTSLNDLVEVGCDDDNADTGSFAAARVIYTQNQFQYYVQVDGYAGEQGNVSFDVIELDCPSAWRVDASGSGDFHELQDGLAAAAGCAPFNGGTFEVQVAAGTYFPTEEGGARTSSFVMERAVRMTGGHPSGFGTPPDPDLNETILSGDLTDAYHVVDARGSRAEIDGVIIENGTADGATAEERSGGGILGRTGVLEVSNSVLRSNTSAEAGSAISHEGFSFELTRSSIEGNSGDGAAVFHNTSSDVLVSETAFTNNLGNFGSSLHIVGSNNARINNTVFEPANSSPLIVEGGRVRVMNSIFDVDGTNHLRLFADADVDIYNSALFSGLGVLVEDASAALLVRNSIVWNVSQPVDPLSVGSISFQDSIVQDSGGSASWDASLGNDLGGNLDVDPEWVDEANGNVRLMNGSPAIDAGDDAGLPLDFEDLDNDGQTNTEKVPDLDLNDRILNGAIDLGPYERAPVPCQPIIYVDVDRPTGGDGLTWNTAFNDLQMAIAQADACTGITTEIWIAEGVYTPHTSDRTVPFILPHNVQVVGGFDGTEVDRYIDRPSPLTNVILSGDLLFDDVAGVFPQNIVPGPDNSQGVILVPRERFGSLSDLTVSGGNADGAAGGSAEGGGIRVEEPSGIFEAGRLELNNVKVSDNTALFRGGGIQSGGDLIVFNSQVSFNTAQDGAGIQTTGSFTLIADSVISLNVATRFGGGLHEIQGQTVNISNSAFASNSAVDGGAMSVSGDVTIVATVFGLNKAGDKGGAVFGNAAGLSILTSEFSFNTSDRLGGAVFVSAPDALISSSTFDANRATTAGGAVFVDDQPDTTLTMNNSVLWDGQSNAGPELLIDGNNEGDVAVRSSIVAGSGGSGANWDTDLGVDLGGNIDADPLFTNTNAFDFTPLPGSPAIGAGDAAVMPLDPFAFGGNDLLPDIVGAPRLQGNGPEIGSREVPEGSPGPVQALSEPCIVYDSTLAAAGLSGPMDGGEIRTISATGNLTGQGGAISCVPDEATAVTFLIAADAPIRAGNFRLSQAGTEPSGGVVNFAPNGLDNANTVTIPVSANGQVDIGANGGPQGAGLPVAGVRLVALAYNAPTASSEFVPVTPCAVADSRSNKGATGSFVGPFDNAAPYPDIDVTEFFDSAQGGGNFNCGIPLSADAVVVNVVAINAAGGTGRVLIGANGTTPSEGTPFAPIGMNNAAVAIVPTVGDRSLNIDIEADPGANTHLRLVALGYFRNADEAIFVPVNPCAAFDTRTTKGSTGDFTGLRQGGEVTTYQISGLIDPEQGGATQTGSCGVPINATGVLINLVAINAVGEGNLQISAAGTSPSGGVLNFAALSPAMNNANAVPVELSPTGQLDVFVNGGPNGGGVDRTHIRGVVLGYYINPPPGPIN